MLSFAACLLATSMAVGQAGKEQPRDEHLQPLQPMIGTWAGKTALDQPIPGIAEKGDEVDFTIVYRYTPPAMPSRSPSPSQLTTKRCRFWTGCSCGILPARWLSA